MFLLERGFERRLIFRDEFLVTGGIEEDLRAFVGEARELAFEIEVTAVRAEEDVAWERAQDAESACEVLRDAGVRRWMTRAVNEMEVRPEAHAADDDDVAQLIGGVAGKMDGKSPRRAAAGVTRGFVRGERDAAELHGIAVVGGTEPEALRKSLRPPLSTTSASPSMTMFFA